MGTVKLMLVPQIVPALPILVRGLRAPIAAATLTTEQKTVQHLLLREHVVDFYHVNVRQEHMTVHPRMDVLVVDVVLPHLV